MSRNAVLYSLGVIFLELAYRSTFRELQRPQDLAKKDENGYSEFLAARDLAKSARTDMGSTFRRIVERLVECDFAWGDDLNNPALQAAVHNHVVRLLEELEQKLQDFLY